mgnify:CR=1 FL=1
MGRSKEEMEGVTLLGNKDVKYSMDYAPEMLQTFDNKHPDNDYFVKFNCPEIGRAQASVRSPDSLTSQRCTYHMCRARRWWRASR